MNQDIVRVLRIVEYVGPRDWVEETVRRSLNYRYGRDAKGKWSITAATITQFPEILEAAKAAPPEGG